MHRRSSHPQPLNPAYTDAQRPRVTCSAKKRKEPKYGSGREQHGITPELIMRMQAEEQRNSRPSAAPQPPPKRPSRGDPMAASVQDDDPLDAPNYALFNLLLETGDGEGGGRKRIRSKTLLRAKAKLGSEAAGVRPPKEPSKQRLQQQFSRALDRWWDAANAGPSSMELAAVRPQRGASGPPVQLNARPEVRTRCSARWLGQWDMCCV